MSHTDRPIAALFRSMARFLGGLLLLIVASVAIAILFGVQRSVWDCEGQYVASTQLGAAQWPEKATMQLERYRPFMVWADSDGNAEVEFHRGGANYFEDLEIAGNAVRIGSSAHPTLGSFSLLSGTLNLSPGIGLGWLRVSARSAETEGP